MPDTTCYRPEGKNTRPDDEVILTLDEFEAIRLADYAGLYQEDAAGRMNVSRQTFGRIVEAARMKIADVLINGKVLRIGGGDVSAENPLYACCNKCGKSVDCSNRIKEGRCPRRPD